VIVGAGFGGIEVAKALCRVPAGVTILDRENHHCFQPLLYQVATAALSPADVAWPARSIFSRQSNVTVAMAEVCGVDACSSTVITTSLPPLKYDFLVLATGAIDSYFGHDEWEAHAPGLKRIEDAIEIRRRLLIAFEKAEVEADAQKRRQLLSFVIVGGGPTGVELAGAVAEIARYALARDFRHIDPRSSRIFLLEAGGRLLPAFPDNLSAYTQSSLSRMGVTVLTASLVTGCDADGVILGNGERILTSTVIWAAGVRASPAGEWMNAECDRAGRVKVNPDLTLPGHPNVFAIGDTAALSSRGRTVPGIAPAAKQMGHYVGQRIAAQLNGTSHRSQFTYRHNGDLATIGRNSAVVSIGRFQLKGRIAWLFWSFAHIYFLIGVRNRVSVALNWSWQYLTFQRGARLITRRWKPTNE
jgi:NADH dehydrogenase